MKLLQPLMPAFSPDSSPSITRASRQFSTARDVRLSLRAVPKDKQKVLTTKAQSHPVSLRAVSKDKQEVLTKRHEVTR